MKNYCFFSFILKDQLEPSSNIFQKEWKPPDFTMRMKDFFDRNKNTGLLVLSENIIEKFHQLIIHTESLDNIYQDLNNQV